MVSEEAYKQLLDIGGRDILSSSQNLRLKDWLELMEEIKNKVSGKVMIIAVLVHTVKKTKELCAYSFRMELLLTEILL